MTSLLRHLVASPRVHHTASNLDLCYVTPSIIATSGPSGTYPTRAYRNPLHSLVKYLDKEHGDQWAIWEFRAEGTGYSDEEVHGRVWHFPWPDHHPPPFHVVPRVVASMAAWLRREDGSKVDDGKKGKKERVVVVHCKAGKGRSGTMSCAYLISEEGWSVEDALDRFTERRMRPGFGAGVSIPSQLRWVGYVDRWAKGGKVYVERQVEVVEVHVLGLRDGVKVGIEGYVDEGKRIKSFHTFGKSERQVVRGKVKDSAKLADVVVEVMGKGNGSGTKRAPSKERKANREPTTKAEGSPSATSDSEAGEQQDRADGTSTPTDAGADVIFRPSSRILLPTNDVNVDFERRNKAMYGYTMVTSVAHVWFNTFFEGRGPEQGGKADDSGVFELEWDKMDGIKGSLRKGTKAFDRFSVVWRSLAKEETGEVPVVLTPHVAGEPIKQVGPPKSQQVTEAANAADSRDLGLRTQTPPASISDLSRASSVRKTQEARMVVSAETRGAEGSGGDAMGTKMSAADGSEMAPPTVTDSSSEDLDKPTARQK